jgi:divalent metal cation (Fe/Co/Zn/Cd) transporter
VSAPRTALVRRGLLLNQLTLAYNSLEGLLSVGAGIAAGSIALVGFGADSVIELAAGVTALWRLRSDADTARRERAEHVSLRVIGTCFLALAAGVAYEACRSLVRSEAAEKSALGVGIAAVSLVTMPLLARAKRRVAAEVVEPAENA